MEDELRIKAKRRAMYILASRDHSKKELYDKLSKSYPPELCEQTVELMEEYGYIDERRYAQKLYGRYIEKGWGKPKIRFELRRRGLPESCIRENEQEYDREDLIEKMTELIEKKYLNKLDLSDPASVRRIIAAMARRGYDYDDIKAAVKRVKENAAT